MEATYARLRDYQAELEVRTFEGDGSFKTEKVVYTFKRPNRIRLDFQSPHPGRVLIYPGRDGKVVVRPWGWAPLFLLRLDRGSSLLEVSPGQRIDQTDLGLLIRNIAHSLSRGRRGPIELTEDDGHIRIRVLAENHFREGIVTLYQFLVDQKLWLPVRVDESRPDGSLERTVIFRNVRVNVGVPDSVFQLDGG
jgi:hypothetical protein